jgi:hypothetical protein
MTFDAAQVLVKSGVEVLSGPSAVERIGPLMDSVYEVVRQQARALGGDRQVEVTSVSIRAGSDEGAGVHGEGATPLALGLGGDKKKKGWPWPFSGSFCFWFCPDGVPPGGGNEDQCYLICIEWWFPVAARA